MIQNGKVTVDGRVVTDLGRKINPGRSKVFVDGKQVAVVHDFVYLALNKPKDTITTVSDERGRTTVMSMVRTKQRVFPIGRLDRNTTGVLLLTNDGEFANRLMHPKYRIPKAYQVTCDRPVNRDDMERLRRGIKLDDGPTSPAEVHSLPGSKGKEIGIVIQEGRNRQVRRMFEALSYEVLKLDRVAYGPVTKHGLPRGATRPLTNAEIRALRAMAGMQENK